MAVAFVPAVRGRVDDAGKLHLSPEMLAFFRRHLERFRGREVEIVARKYDPQRSDDQNEYLHAVPFPILAAHFGDSVEGVKLSLMGECWGWKVDPITGRYVPIKPHTSQMSKAECTHFIDWLLPWALIEHGIDIPPPTRAGSP